MYKKEKLLISFSGGRTSAYMTWYILNKLKDKYEIIVVFANTGKEREETLDFVNNCDIYFQFNTVWVEAVVNNEKNKGTTHIVTNYKNAKRNGEPFEDVISKYGIPNTSYLHCTRELKLQPIKSYAKSIGWKYYKTALGIRSDEPKRIDWSKREKNNLLYFAELINVTKSDVNNFWSKQNFDLNLKSYEGNCDLCYKKSLRKLMTIIKENPNFVNWWDNMEKKYENFTPESRLKTAKPPYRFFRDNMTINEIIEDSKYDFVHAVDENNIIDKYKQMSIFDNYLDSNSGCVESCEIF